MSIKITQPFSFDSKRPNFERDVIDSSSLFVSQNPLDLTSAERIALAENYDVGHIVWDTYTSIHYGVAQSPTEANECVLVKLDLTNTTLSGVVYCDSDAITIEKFGIMPGFSLVNGQSVLLYLKTSNTVASATLNVNSTGEKPVMIGGSPTTTTNFKSGWWLCRYDGTNWNCEPTQVQANWNETNSSSPSFIQNKPTIPTVRTMNGEQLTDSSLGDINIHDGYYFPNAVTDYEGNWYGAVVIGDQVWLAENLKTHFYPSTEEDIPEGLDSSSTVGYCYPMVDELGGFYYNWAAVMDGNSDSNEMPSGVRGIAPEGFHIPSKQEFEILLRYMGSQTRYTQNQNDSISKALSSTSGWTTDITPGDGKWPSVGLEYNNKSGFNSRQGGYYFNGINEKNGSAFYWTTTLEGNSPVYFSIQNERENPITSRTSAEIFCAVRCLSNLTPIQFRDWYVNTYGTMQHHLAQNGILNTTSTTSQIPSSNESLGGTINLHKVSKTGSYTDLLNTPDISASLYEEIRYSSLIDKINNSQLVKGKMYRIIDYETTTTQENTRSAGNKFDLVVTAISTNKLDHRASALVHDGDNYFTAAQSNLEKWQIWYDVLNTETLYPWADTRNGKGVIYRMIDEYGNEAPYDFKNIQFYTDKFTGQLEYFYTFSYHYLIDLPLQDLSLESGCYGNIIKKIESGLNFIVIFNEDYTDGCYGNKFDYGCCENYLRNKPNNVVFGQRCYKNIISGENIHFGDDCTENTIGFSPNTVFGQRCSGNKISRCENIHFGDDCEYNSLGYNYNVVFGNHCSNNKFSSVCQNIELGNNCDYIILSTTYCDNIRVGSNNDHIKLYNNITTPDTNNKLQNIYIVQGFNNSSDGIYTEISSISRGLKYRTTIGRQTNGNERIYNEEDEILSVPYATQSGSVGQPLHIGPHNYDGSAEVFVDIYDSDYYISSDYQECNGNVLTCFVTSKNVDSSGFMYYKLNHSPKEIVEAAYSGKIVAVIDKGEFPYSDMSMFFYRYSGHYYNNRPGEIVLTHIKDGKEYELFLSGGEYESIDAIWSYQIGAISESNIRIDDLIDDPTGTIDISYLVRHHTSMRVLYNNRSNLQKTISITGYTGNVYVRNISDLVVDSNKQKVFTISYIGGYCYVESWTPIMQQTSVDNEQEQ